MRPAGPLKPRAAAAAGAVLLLGACGGLEPVRDAGAVGVCHSLRELQAEWTEVGHAPSDEDLYVDEIADWAERTENTALVEAALDLRSASEHDDATAPAYRALRDECVILGLDPGLEDWNR